LIFSANKLNRDGSILDAVPDKVVMHLDVLATVVEHGVLAQLDCRLVVHVQISNEGISPQQIAKQTAEPYSLARRRRHCDVFRFAGRHWWACGIVLYWFLVSFPYKLANALLYR
jgi:hypothetical protein